MCHHSISLYLWLLSIITIATGLACIVAGTAGKSWWESRESAQGLWNSHNTMVNCVFREHYDVLKFGDDKKLDAILLVMIISASSAFLAFLSVFLMLCCQSKLDKWKFGSLMTTLLTFISTVFSFAALTYTEIEFQIRFNKCDHGWSIIVAWIGSGVMCMAFVLSFVLLCASERDFPENGASYEKQSDVTRMADRGGAVNNNGFEMS